MASERIGDVSYAGFWARLAAYIVDCAIVITLTLVVAIGAAFAGEIGIMIGFVINLLINFLYWPVLESSARQATFGKSMVGIQVTDLNGNRMTFLRAFLRNLAKIISSIPLCIGFLMAALTARKQALHDMITDSLVVRTGASHFFKAFAAALVGLIISVGAGGAYFKYIYLPQAQNEFGTEIQAAMESLAKSATHPENLPAPAKQAVAPQTAASAPPAVSPTPVPDVMSGVAETSRMELATAGQASAVIATAASQPVVELTPKTKTPVPEAEPEKFVRAAQPEPAPVMDSLSGAESTSREAMPRSPEARSDAPPAMAFAPDTESRVIKPKYNDVMTAVLRSDYAAVKQLLDLGWWVDKPSADGYTPLMAAVMNRDTQMAQLLLDHGAIPNPQLLKLARDRKDTETVLLLERRGVR